MEKLSFSEIQQLAYSILAYMKKVCDENGITFFLAYGTVLGAVRHNGFIPWDDDIDVYFTRAEFTKFEAVMRSESQRYRLMSVTTDKDYCHPLAKLVDTATAMDWHIVKVKPNYGVWVDIYILDNVPDDTFRTFFFQSRLNALQKCYEHALYKSGRSSLRSRVKSLLLGWTDRLGPRFFAERMVRLSQRYNDLTTKRFAPNAFTAASRREAVLYKDVIGHGSGHVFESDVYLLPEKTDLYLRHFYGDYSVLPPVEKRVSNHSADFYLKDHGNSAGPEQD